MYAVLVATILTTGLLLNPLRIRHVSWIELDMNEK